MMVRFASAAGLVAILALSGCAPDFNPPPDYKGGFLWDSDHSRSVTVGADDTLYSVSRRYDVPPRVIIARNNLQAPYALIPGQTLILDPLRTHHVERGETVGILAAKYRVPQSLIVEANDLPAPYILQEGQTVWIPDPFTVAAAEPLGTAPPRSVIRETTTTRTTTGPESDMPPPAPVRSGGSVIAASALPPPPGATAIPGSPGAPRMLPPPDGAPAPLVLPPQPDTVRLSQQGIATVPSQPSDNARPPMTPGVPRVPMPPQPSDSARPAMAPGASMPPQPSDSMMPNAPPRDPGMAPAGRPLTPSAPVPPSANVPPAPLPPPPVVTNPPQTAVPSPPAQVAALPPAPQPSGGAAADVAATKFVWPVKGRLITGFGPAGQGLHNDGINIAAPQGTQVRAAGNGTVVYAGSELKGFGNLLLIKHDNGLTTAYAHTDKLLVAKGDQVRQGQVVATVGKTGNVDAPQLHFEVRRGTQAVDPQQFLQR